MERNSKRDPAPVNDNAATGLVAAALLNAQAKNIIIAFRGIDNARDLATMIALGADNTYVQQLLEMPDPLNIGMGEENQRLLRKGQGKLIDGWSPQIGEALEYVKRVMDAYPGHSIEVTGYGLGGSLAQVAAHTYGLDGRAFNPLGAQNVVDSQGYAQWLREHGIDKPQGMAAPQGRHDPGGFMSYTVNRHAYGDIGGPQLGAWRHVSPLAGREGLAEYGQYALKTVADAVGEVPVVGRAGKAADALGAAQWVGRGILAADALLQDDRQEMTRQVRVFEQAALESRLPTIGQDRHAAQPGIAQADASQPAPSGNPFLDPQHPHHARYQELKQHWKDADPSEARLAQFTAACHMAGFPAREPLTHAHVAVDGSEALLRVGWPPGTWTRVGLDGPVPSVQRSVQQIAEFDQRLAQQMAQSEKPEHDPTRPPPGHGI